MEIQERYGLSEGGDFKMEQKPIIKFERTIDEGATRVKQLRAGDKSKSEKRTEKLNKFRKKVEKFQVSPKVLGKGKIVGKATARPIPNPSNIITANNPIIPATPLAPLLVL